MNNLSFSDISLPALINRLEIANANYGKMLSHHADKQNEQVGQLLQLGMVSESPQAPQNGVGHLGNVPPPVNDSVLVKFAKALNTFEELNARLDSQIGDAGFIATAIGKQIAIPENIKSSPIMEQDYGSARAW